MKIKIKHNIKIPPVDKSGGGNYTFPFGEMRVNDSFFYCTSSHKLLAAALAWSKRDGRKGYKFVVRQICGIDNKIVGARIWRVK